MAIIITNTNWLQIDGTRFQKGKWDLSRISTGVRLSDAGERIDIPYLGTTIDDAEITSVDELFDFFNAQGFKQGGTDPGAVTGVQSVTGSLVTGTPEHPMVNIPTWEQIPDVPTVFTPEDHTHVKADITDLNIEQVATGSTVVERTATGQGRFTPGVANDEAIVVSQLNESLQDVVKTVDGTIPESQLPSYVDNVQEGTLLTFPNPGMSNIVYLDTETNIPYRWGGSSYVEITSGGVALGETSATAYRGDRGKIAFDHTSLTNNPHGVTATQVGLGNVDNTSDLDKPVSTATQEALDSKADLVDGKIPQEQLPTATEGSSLITQVTAASTTQYIIADIPNDAPNLLRFELYIPDTLTPSFIGMRFNGLSSGIYKHVLQNINNASYSIVRNYSQNQMRVLSSSSGAVVGRYNIRIEGTINNVAGQIKIANGTSYLAGSAESSGPDINNFFGSAHDQELTDGKITQLLFVAQNSGGTARISSGSVLKIYGIK